jgi:cytochrome c-type biogenesis protein CcmH
VLALLGVLVLAAAPDPGERLPDPAQEARARSLFRELRCVVCQSESIDDSDADLARDLRRLVREQVQAGKSDAEVRDYLVARYGDFILLKPRFEGGFLVLWLLAPAMLLGGGAWLLAQARRRRAAEPPLSPEEEARLAALTAGGQDPAGHAFAPQGSHKDAPNDGGVT